LARHSGESRNPALLDAVVTLSIAARSSWTASGSK